MFFKNRKTEDKKILLLFSSALLCILKFSFLISFKIGFWKKWHLYEKLVLLRIKNCFLLLQPPLCQGWSSCMPYQFYTSAYLQTQLQFLSNLITCFILDTQYTMGTMPNIFRHFHAKLFSPKKSVLWHILVVSPKGHSWNC